MNKQYVSEPVEPNVEAKIEIMRGMLRKLDQELGRLESLFDERYARDDLTGLLRRNAFQIRSENLFSRCRETGANHGLLLLDLDHFKKLNDSFGHHAGDHLLKNIGQLLRSYESPDCVVCRFGGEEFALAVRGNPAQIAEEIRKEVQRLAIEAPFSCTASIGMKLSNGTETTEDLLRAADQALYRAKDLGRNRVEAA
ncbi:MAG: hypothetical protein A2X94_05835 [Bdellovibrionales bacterium GWB1_55_8]|nr:MAG: hypothetical protein A2X94_05835 [Bdellovibrionales bacterium GWB1_55_8]